MGVSGVQNGHPTVNSQHRCQCVDDLLAPIRSKMKVLKKIKKRIGIGTPRSGGERFTNNLPPILFHQVHGDNIRISGNGSIARRVESFCRGVTFSDRPIKIQEKVCVKFLEVSNNWSGVIRFGFTCNDPSNLRYSLPKYACPDLTNKPGYWAKALAERFAERDTVLFYYVTATGDVHFGINGEEKGVFFSGVETRGPLWALFDVYGNSTGIELVDQRIPLNNSRRTLVASNEGSPDIDAHILPSLQALSIQNSNQRNSGGGDAQNESNLVSRYQQPGTDLTPLPFHRTRGHNIRMSNDRCVATRSNTEFCLGYVFTARPIQLGEKIIIQVLATESMYVGALAFGLTNCDPSTLETGDLPEDADSLLDRPEYWVVQKDVANNPQRGDELAFSVSQDGEVQISKNGGPPVVFMHVDQTLQLWAFFDVYGSTQKVRILGAAPSPCRNSSSPPPRTDSSSAARFRVNLPCSGESSHGNGPQFIPNCGNILPHPVNQSNGPSPRYCCGSGAASATASPTVPATSTELVQLQPAMGGGTVLVVNLPPAHSNFINHQQQQPKRHSPPSSYHGHHPHVTHSSHGPHSNGIDRLPLSSGTLLSDYSNTYIEPVSSGSYSTMDSTLQWSEGSTGTTTGSECSICYERSIDSVLYMCGHMCMCYDCAIQQWKGKGGGHCPLCRAVIRDVIRTYKS